MDGGAERTREEALILLLVLLAMNYFLESANRTPPLHRNTYNTIFTFLHSLACFFDTGGLLAMACARLALVLPSCAAAIQPGTSLYDKTIGFQHWGQDSFHMPDLHLALMQRKPPRTACPLH